MVTARGSGGEAGGAERFYEALVASFRELGHEAVEVPVVIDEPNFERIQRNYLACYDLDLRPFDMVVSTKAPTWMIRHPRHVCYLVHTIRVFYDMFEATFPKPWPGLLEQRDWIHRIDTEALTAPRCRAVFTIGREVSDRLKVFNGIEASALHPPLWENHGFSPGRQGDYFFLPGRLHPWKRVDLVIRAFLKTSQAKRLLIAGSGESEEELRKLARGDPRIEFLGRISDEDLARYYAGALAVPFMPIREDYGYVTLEAFASGKPVITCVDSGEAANIVEDGVSGFVCPPEEQALAEAMDRLAANHALAAALGRQGKTWVDGLAWRSVAERLIKAAGGGQKCELA